MTQSPRDKLFKKLTGLRIPPPHFFENQALHAEWLRVNYVCRDDFDRLIKTDPRIEFIEAVAGVKGSYVQVVVKTLDEDYQSIPKTIQSYPVRISATKVDHLDRCPSPV